MDWSLLDRRPVVVCVAGPNGAGKTTFFAAHLRPSGLPFVNADVLSHDLELGPYEAARLADALRRAHVARRESFVFETVLSDPVGAKIGFLGEAQAAGYSVIFCFIGISSPAVARARVAMRVSQGGHDVPDAKLEERFDRTLANLGRALRTLPHVLVFDNEDLVTPFRAIVTTRDGVVVSRQEPVPGWLDALLA